MKKVTVFLTAITCMVMASICNAQNNSALKNNCPEDEMSGKKQITITVLNPADSGFVVNEPLYDPLILHFERKSYLRPTDEGETILFLFTVLQTGTTKVTLTARQPRNKERVVKLKETVVLVTN